MQPVLLEPNWKSVLDEVALSGTLQNFSSTFLIAREEQHTDEFKTLKGPGRAIGAEVRLNMVLCPVAVHLWCEVFPRTDAADPAAGLQQPILAFPVISSHGSAVNYCPFFLEWPLLRGGCVIAVSCPSGASTQRVGIDVRRWKMQRGE